MKSERILKKAVTLFAIALMITLVTQCGKDDEVTPLTSSVTSGTDVINTYDGDYSFDMFHSDILWATAYAGANGNLVGQFDVKAINIDFDEANPSAGKIEAWVQLSSINTGEGRDAVDACLPGFLGVVWTGGAGDTLADGTKDPAFNDPTTDTAKFISTSIQRYGNGYLATGNFTFLGVTNAEKLYFTYEGYVDTGDPPTTRKAGFQGTLTFKSRSVYGLEAGSTYDLTGDEVTLSLSCNVKKPL